MQLKPGDSLLVAKRDRLGRDPIVVAMIESAVVRKGARIVSAAGEGTEGDEPSHVLMRHLIDAFAEYERLIIVARTKAALQAKKARGERVGYILGRLNRPICFNHFLDLADWFQTQRESVSRRYSQGPKNGQ
jgi:DNA invertase Pin-like site-specific DNA recombinase